MLCEARKIAQTRFKIYKYTCKLFEFDVSRKLKETCQEITHTLDEI